MVAQHAISFGLASVYDEKYRVFLKKVPYKCEQKMKEKVRMT